LHYAGYRAVRQTGSHIRLQIDHPKPHAVTVPNHSPLKLGTLAAILADIAEHRGISKAALAEMLFNA
jgi:predicted RNA binding protein YcfA (HicA-like mRNA interferase family)